MMKDRCFWVSVYLIATLLVITISISYVNHEDPVYIWDWAGYFNRYQQYGRAFYSPDWFEMFFKSISVDDYNPSTLLLLMPFFELFGGGRAAYISGLFVTYMVPTVFLIGAASTAALSRNRGKGVSRLSALTIIFAAISFSPFWAAALRGLPDVAGLVPLSCATYLLWKPRYLDGKPIKRGILIGGLLWSAFLFRRWYAFSVISILVTAGLFAVSAFYSERDPKRLLRHASGFIAISFTIITLLALFQLPLFVRILTTSYTDIYAGYRSSEIAQILEVYHRTSALIWVFIGTGLTISIIRRNSFPIFCSISALTNFLFFTRTQDMAFQHSLPVFLWLFPAYAQSIYEIMGIVSSRWARTAASMLVAIVGLSAFLGAFSPQARHFLSLASFSYPTQATLPLRLENFAEYERLTADLEKLLRPGQKIAVFASSPLISDSLLVAIDPGLKAAISWVAHVDSRDKFRVATLAAKYVVATDPPALHLKRGAQDVIEIPNSLILHGFGIGSAYRRLDAPYDLAGHRKAYIYERIRPITDAEINDLLSRIRRTNASQADLFRASKN